MNPCPGVVEFPHEWILNKRMRFVASPLPNALTSVYLEYLLPTPGYKSLGKPSTQWVSSTILRKSKTKKLLNKQTTCLSEGTEYHPPYII